LADLNVLVHIFTPRRYQSTELSRALGLRHSVPVPLK